MNSRVDGSLIAVPPPLDPTPLRASATPATTRRGGRPKKPKGPAKKRVVGERFRTLNNFVDCSLATLSRSEMAVWFILYRDTRDGLARTAMTDLARRAGCSKRQVVTAIKRLEAKGLLQVVYRGGRERGISADRCVAVDW
jgi:hypothetical protein